MRRHAACWASVVLLILASRAAAEGSDREEAWHEYFLQGQKVGWSHTTTERAEYEGQAAWRTSSQQEMRIKARGVETVTRTEEEGYSTLDFVPLFAKSRREEKSQVTEDDVVVRDGKARVRRKVNDAVEEREIDLAGRTVHDQSGAFYAGLHLEPGASASDHAIEAREFEISDVKITAETRETLPLAGARHDVLRLRIENSLYKNLPMSIWLRDDGLVVRMEAGPLSMRLATEEEAKRFKAVQELPNMLPVRPVVLFPSRFREVTLSIRIEGGDTKELLTDGAYHRVSSEGDVLTVALLAQPAPEGVTVERPVMDPSVAEFLKSSPRCNGDDPEIQAKAKEVIGDEKDALAAARRIVHWVYRSIKKESSAVGAKTAKETLMEGSGDCTEHAVLTAALCRAAGIPARSVTGLMWVGKEAGYHQWAEVWVGRWLPVDATLDSVGTPPAYLCFGLSDEKAASAETTARMMRFFGRATVSLVAVRGEGLARSLSARERLVEESDDRVDHFGWGVSFQRPTEWKYELRKDQDVAVFENGRAILQLRPLVGAPPLSLESAQELQGTLMNVLSEMKVPESSLVEKDGRRVYRSEVSGRMKGDPMRYRLAFVQANGCTFLTLFTMRDVPSFADEAKAFETFLDQLRVR